MKYTEYLETNKETIQYKLNEIIRNNRVQPVGNGYIDCIVLKADILGFMHQLSELGILVTGVSWWCHVDKENKPHSNCPHGMGGPVSKYHTGWFSELQNDMLTISEKNVERIEETNEKKLTMKSNENLIELIEKTLQVPFRFTPTEYIEDNECVVPALWLRVPDDWKSEI